ncbi:hypothetical protein [Rhodococcus sp. Q]|uniref:hypothetical protein n=1 Tax=Rhodococcus sp. Q TaxID=2502252 RepID=UPI0010F589A3|nr:hypothetical protein [Rhodococcus sp. Q]
MTVAAQCRRDGCARRTRSSTGRCEEHRRKIPVSITAEGWVNIGQGLTLSSSVALDLANRIVDAIEERQT